MNSIALFFIVSVFLCFLTVVLVRKLTRCVVANDYKNGSDWLLCFIAWLVKTEPKECDKVDNVVQSQNNKESDSKNANDAIDALVVLGFKKSEAKKCVDKAISGNLEMAVDEIVKKCLASRGK